MKFLVTGGAGFIGSHLVDHLISNGHDVICVDDFSNGKEHYLNKTNRLSIINAKIQKIKPQELPKDINGIFHLAAQASVPVSIDKFYSSSANNLLSSLRSFDLSKFFSIPIVYASSSAVYGNLPVGDDQENKYEIISPYSQDKLTLEDYARMCWNVYKIPSIGLRFFNVYGPRQDPSNPYSGVISIFIDRLLKNKSITVNGGYQTRDFIFVKDVINVIITSMQSLITKKYCDYLNVGTGKSISINNLVKILEDILNVRAKIKLEQLPSGDPEKSIGTYNKLREKIKIDTSQFVKLKDGIE